MLNQPSLMIETLLILCFSKWWGTSFWECLINHGSMCGPIIYDPCLHETTSLEISKLVRSHFNDESTGNVFQFSSVQFSCSLVSDFLWPHRLQHTRLPCPLPTPGACSNSCPSSQWYHPPISFSVIPFSSCLQSFPASGSLSMSQFLHQLAKVLELQL